MSENISPFEAAKAKASGASSAAASKEPGTALTVKPAQSAELEVIEAEKKKYDITPALQDAAVQQYIIKQDISALSKPMQVAFYVAECKRLRVDPASHPIDLLKDKEGRLKPYYNSECATQMENDRNVSCTPVNQGFLTDEDDRFYFAEVKATGPDGRSKTRKGIISVKGLKGQEKANAMMKAETKANRRATLALLGMSTADEGDGQVISAQKFFSGEELQEATPPALPEIEDVFGSIGQSLLGADQPDSTGITQADQETGTPAEEEAEEVAVIPPSSSEALSLGEQSSSEESPLENSETSTSTTGPESTTDAETAQSTSQNASNDAENLTTKDDADQSTTEDEDLDSIFADLEEDAFEFDPEDAQIVNEKQLQEIFNTARRNGWYGEGTEEEAKKAKAAIVTEIARHARITIPEIPKMLTVGQYKKAIEWFTHNTIGSQFLPLGQTAEAAQQ